MSKEMAKGGGVKQTRPQETDSTYSKAIDKQVAGKPVGWRFTDKLAKKLGKKVGTKPTAQEIEKYKNKGVYFETRKNKSDLNPKAKLDHGGDSSEILSDGSKLDNFTAVGIAEGFVENDNAHDQIKAWAYIQRHGMCRNLQGWFGRTCAAMIDNGIFDREGNIDYDVLDTFLKNRKEDGGDVDYAKGGKTKGKYQVMFFEEEGGSLIDSEYYSKKPSEKEIDELGSSLKAKYAELYRDKHQDDSYDYLEEQYDFEKGGYMAKGGQTAPQRESYSKRGDRQVKAKPAGYRFTEKLANRLGKNVYAKPTPEQVSKYSGKGVYFENRKDKSDVKPNEYLAMGGVSQHGLRKGDKIVEVQGEYAGVDNKNQHFAVDISKGERRKITGNSIGQVLKNPKKEDGGDIEYAKGGALHNLDSLNDIYEYFDNKPNENADYQIEDYISKKVKERTGYKTYFDWVDLVDEKTGQTIVIGALAAKDQNNASSGFKYKLSQILNKAEKFYEKNYEDGGDVDYAKGGNIKDEYIENYMDSGFSLQVTEYTLSGQPNPSIFGYFENMYDFVSYVKENVPPQNFNVEVDSEYSRVFFKGDKEDLEEFLLALINDAKKDKPGRDESYAKGGQTAAQRESYSKRGDREVKAKPVGYRFTDALAKRLGKSATTKPTAEQIRKYLGKGIYFENRKDKSDIKPNEYLAKGGGIKQTRPQETDSTYSKSIDKQVSGKPVGYRFTDKLAKRLGKNPLTAPKISEIEKYKGKGVYFETRKNKSDVNPKGKLAYGGVTDVDIQFARGGGVPRTSNADSKAFTENHLPFVANNLEGKTLENGDYVVLSYGYYPIWFWHKRTNKWYGNKDKFSVTTAKHISQSRPTYEAEMLSRGEMDNLMSKSIEGKDFKEMGGTLDSFVVAQQ